ncbi:bacillithiol system redox-active protein YtxJ [Sporosarcina contaminans]|uniref:Bacillithiol system redox-active protein YtxJ n=1 Tax=Sporosarcina contaminans TaxID=633403 RepID=A0ABW3TX69_9BACL
MIEIKTSEEWKNIVEQSRKAPIFVLKHSATCPISASGHHVFEHYETSISKYYLIVQKNRSISNEIEKDLNVRHETPQVLLLKDGEAVWYASHYDISKSSMKSAVEEHC